MTDLPCGHPIAGSLHECADDGDRRLNLQSALPPSDWGPETIAAQVWCGCCYTWVTLTDEQYDTLSAVRAPRLETP